MKNANDVRVLRTHEAIRNAFEEMVCEGKLKEINVKELTARAGIHRKTFYLHYNSIEELYAEALSDVTSQYAKIVESLPQPYSYFDLTRILFEFYSSNPYMETLFCNTNYSEISSKIIETTLKHNREYYNPFSQYSPEMQNIINTFVTSASNSSYRKWVEDGKIVPMEEAIDVVSTLLENGVSAITSSK